MLALTPAPLQTDGERSFFAELARWDTGGAVRAAVVAAIPFSDGQLDRRISDAVLLVPEGIAVVRIAEVARQSGVVTASADGAWTIAPQPGPGEVLQLGGGGSTPLDGLMRAGMETAVRLRRAGLEPGRIARLTVLVGQLDGLVPADGDLGEGDQVALLEPRSLLLGIARCSRYSQVDNPRLWTTADVRAALEALGLQGRMPSVEELNGEGFPYSPYVLRRPELLAPAAIAALSPERPAGGVEPRGAVPAAAPFREQPSPGAVAQALAASVAAARAAEAAEFAAAAGGAVPVAVPTHQASGAQTQQTSAPRPHPTTAAPGPRQGDTAAPVARQRDTVAIDQPPAAEAAVAAPPAAAPAPVVPEPLTVQPTLPAQVPAPAVPGAAAAPQDAAPPAPGGTAFPDTGGIGGLFRAAEPVPAEAAPPTAVQASPWSVQQPPPAVEQRPRTLAFAAAQPPPAAPPAVVAPPSAVPPLAPAGAGTDDLDDEEEPRRRTGLLAGLALALVVLLAVAGWLVLRDPDPSSSAAAGTPTETPSQTVAPGPQPGDVQDVAGVRYTFQVAQVDDTCVGHAYGETAEFFAATDCTGLSRALYSAQLDGGAVVVSVARVRMADTAAARSLQALTDRNGSGNVSDLLREGVTYAGGPEGLSSAEYASAVSGPTVTIVESSWVDPASAGSAADVDRMAANGLALQVPPFAD